MKMKLNLDFTLPLELFFENSVFEFRFMSIERNCGEILIILQLYPNIIFIAVIAFQFNISADPVYYSGSFKIYYEFAIS